MAGFGYDYLYDNKALLLVKCCSVFSTVLTGFSACWGAVRRDVGGHY